MELDPDVVTVLILDSVSARGGGVSKCVINDTRLEFHDALTILQGIPIILISELFAQAFRIPAEKG